MTYRSDDFAGCTITECEETELYLKACIKDYKAIHAIEAMMSCMSHLSAIRLALLEKTSKPQQHKK